MPSTGQGLDDGTITSDISPIDRYTLVHAIIGLTIGRYTDWSLDTALLFGGAWEVFENTFLHKIGVVGLESAPNMVIDVVALGAGVSVGRKFRPVEPYFEEREEDHV
jgi:hypothetical protein